MFPSTNSTWTALVLLTVVCPAIARGAEPSRPQPPQQVDVFVAGQDNVHTYRIPSMLATPGGSLLVFCEARKQGIRDASPTDMVLKRSLDAGRTWLPVQTLVHGQGNEAIMNPCPVVDRTTGTILLFCIKAHKIEHGRHRHLLLTSRDEGKTWSEPADLADRIAPYDDTFVSGPGVGIQTRSGRLVIPGYTGRLKKGEEAGLFSRVIYSDDHGKSWRMGQPVSAPSNECQAVELADGRLMLNMRDNTGQNCRAVALSDDGGQSWSKVYWDRALNECPCQASLIRYSDAQHDGKNRLLFANPDIRGTKYGAVDRTKMTVRLSYDEGQTWPVAKLIHAGPSSYSSLVRLPDGDIGLVYEGGRKHRREWIRFARISLAWLSDGKDPGAGSRPPTKAATGSKTGKASLTETIWVRADQASSYSGPVGLGSQLGIAEDGALGDYLVPLVCVEPKKLDGGYAEFRVQIPRSATYYVWARLRYPVGIRQSFALIPAAEKPTGDSSRAIGDSAQDVDAWHWDNRGGDRPGQTPLALDLKQGEFVFRVYPRESSATVFRPARWRMARPEFNPRLNLLCFTTDANWVPTDEAAGRELKLTPSRVDVSALRVPPVTLPPVSDDELKAYGKQRIPDWLRAPRWFTKDSWRFELGLRKPGDVAWMVRQLAANEVSAFRLSAFWGGEAYYPSKVAPHAPGLGSLDYLQEATDEGRRCGVRVVLYVNPNALYEGHPLYDEAAIRAPDGKPLDRLAYGIPGTRYACVENPQYRRFLLTFLAEAFSRYDLAGLYVDGLTPQSCFCRWCRARYEKMWHEPMPVEKFAAERGWGVLWEMTSRNDPLGDPADAQWQRYTQFRARSLDDITREVRQTVEKTRPGAATLFHSWPKPGCLDCYDGSLTEIYIRNPWRHTLWKPFELASLANSFPVPMFFNIYLHDFGSQAEARLKAAQGLASGCYPNFWNLAAMRPMFRFMRENAEYFDFARTRPVPFLLFPRAIHVDRSLQRVADQTDPRLRFRPDRFLSPYVGFAAAMTCGGVPMVSMERHDFHQKLAPYRVLALVNEACLSDTQAQAVRRWVADGGGLVASGETSLYDEFGARRADFALADVLGAHYESLQAGGPSKWSMEGDRVFHVPALPAHEEPYVKVRVDGGRVLATLTLDRPGAEPVPAVIVRQFGKGRVVYLPGRLDAMQCERLDPGVQELLVNALRWAAGDRLPVEVKAEGRVGVSLFEQPNRRMIHLVNLQGDSLFRSDAVTPLGRLQVDLLCPRDEPPRRVRRLWAGSDATFSQNGRRLTVELDRLDLYEVIAVEWDAAAKR